MEKHNSVVHKTGQLKKKFDITQMSSNQDQEEILDNEGIDVSEWLLEEKKRFVHVHDESKMIAKYNTGYDVMKLFPHFVQ